MKKWFVVVVLSVGVVCSSASAETLRFDSLQRGQREITVSLGYGENHRIPEAVKDRLAFDALGFRYAWFTSPRTQVAFEISAGKHVKGQENFSISSVLSYRRYFLVRGGTALGYDLGIGLIRMDDEMDGLGTKINFTEQVGLTWQVATGTRSAFTLEYRFCHISNGDTKRPNVGMNVSMLSMGHSWYR